MPDETTMREAGVRPQAFQPNKFQLEEDVRLGAVLEGLAPTVLHSFG